MQTDQRAEAANISVSCSALGILCTAYDLTILTEDKLLTVHPRQPDYWAT